jgi:hypothetical protein
MARTKKAYSAEMSWQALDALCQYSPTLKYCAEYLAVSEDTIEKRIRDEFDCTFSEYREMKAQKVVLKLKEKAVKMALDGNPMMIKYVLGNLSDWREKVESNVTSNGGSVKIQIVKDENQIVE